MDNKQKIIKEIFQIAGDGTSADLLNCMEAFQNLIDDGYIEEFTNDYGETDYKISNRYDAMTLLKELKD